MEREPHNPEGGEHQHENHETRSEPIFEQLSDEQRIQRGIADALNEGRPIDDETARRIASQLHSGQDSALYALASSGALADRLERELLESVQDLPVTRDSWIDALLDYADARGEDRGPRKGWVEVTQEEFEQFTLPDEQAVEQMRIEAAEQRVRDRQRFDRLVGAGLRPDDAESLVEFEHFVRQQRAEQAAAGSEPVDEVGVPGIGQGPGATEGTTSPERGEPPHPRIYVVCLASYNNGLRHGQWIDANQNIETLRDEIETMLNASPVAEAEEYAVHDHEGFMGYELGEYEDLVTVSRVAAGIAEHGRAFALYAQWAGSDEETLGRFEDHYMGRWDSAEEWARDAGEDFGWERQLEALEIDPLIKPYVKIDYESFARDMTSQWHMVEAEDGVYVFAL